MKRLLTGLLVLLSYALPAQNLLITTENPDQLTVCGNDTIHITLINTSGAPLSNILLTVSMPSGVAYQAGSIDGATEDDISTPNVPVFEVADLTPGASQEVFLIADASCGLVEAINSGQLFTNEITANHSAGSDQVTSLSYIIETGLLLVVSVDPAILSGQKGDVLQRQITLRNTRLGPIERIRFTDEHNPGYDAAAPGAVSQNNVSGVFFEAEFDGSFFTGFGDGDELLEFNEEIIITEEITITDCGDPALESFSEFKFGWGCGSFVCQQDSAEALVNILPSDANPELAFSATYAPNVDMCGQTAAKQHITVVNNGSEAATNVSVDVRMFNPASTGMDSGSFEINDGSGWQSLVPNISEPTTLQPCEEEFNGRTLITIPEVAAGATVQVRFDAYSCADTCSIVQANYFFYTFYKKSCPSTAIVTDSIFASLEPATGNFVSGRPFFEIDSCLEENISYELLHRVISPLLLQDSGFLEVILTLPKGIYWDSTCDNSIEGQMPLAFSENNLSDGIRELSVTYELPFSNDTVFMPYCILYDCQPNMDCKNGDTELDPNATNVLEEFPFACDDACVLEMESATIIKQNLDDEPLCGVGDCYKFPLIVNDTCNAPPPPDPGNLNALLVSYDVYRTNYGFEDDNDDRFLDSNDPPDLNLIRDDRYISGDTLRFDMKGVVIIGEIPYVIFNVFHEAIQSEMPLLDGDLYVLGSGTNQLTNRDSLQFLEAELTVKKTDGSTETCPLNFADFSHQIFITLKQVNVEPESVIDRLITMHHEFYLPLQDCSPDGLPLQLGDSVFFKADFKFRQNFIPPSDTVFTPPPPLVNFRTTMWRHDRDYAWKVQGWQGPLGQYSGYLSQLTMPQYSIRACQTSFEVSPFKYSIRIARENMFPYEVRPLSRLLNFTYDVPVGVAMQSANVDLSLQESQLYLLDEDISWTLNGQKHFFDYSPFYQVPLDEGYQLQTQYVFGPSCTFEQPDTTELAANIQHPECFPGPSLSMIEDTTLEAFYGAIPILSVTTPDSIVEQLSPVANIELNIKNVRPANAPNTWLYIEPINGNLSDIELFQMPQQQPYPGLAGLYQLGTTQSLADQQLLLRARNTNCNALRVRIVIGWSCDPVTSPESPSCGRDTLEFELRLQNAVLELNPLEQPESIPMCAPSEYIVFEVSNANSGNALSLTPSIRLPQGISVVDGSTEVQYPAGSGWLPGVDPSLLPGNIFRWKLEELVPSLTLEGLPGFQTYPANTFLVRFRVEAECGFVANSQPIYGVEGTQPCGLLTNILRKPGDPLQLEGVNEDYDVDISLSTVGNDAVYCGETLELSVQMIVGGTPSASDSIYLILPSGVSYEPGSYIPGLNAAPGPPDQNGQLLQLPLPTNINPGSVVQFNIQVRYDETVGCIDQFLTAQARQQSSAFCQSTGMFCDVYIATGEALLQLPAQNPELDLLSFTPLSISNGVVDFEAVIQNAGDIIAPQAILQLFLDQNNNGNLDSTDQLLLTLEHLQDIAPGNTITLTGTINLSVSELCQLLAVLPAEENCACAPLVFPVENWDFEKTSLASCELDPISFGVSETAGSTYNWQPGNLLDCSDCAMTTFNPGPNVMPGDVFLFVLEETAGNCTISHPFEITFGVELGIDAPDQTICLGDTIVLEATAGGSYEWTGPGIDDPGSQSQIVSPTSNSQYIVTITLQDDCMGVDTVNVSVLEGSNTDLGIIRTCPGIPVDVFGTLTSQPGEYCEEYMAFNGCDSIVCLQLENYDTLGISEMALCEGDSLLVFDSLVTNPGTYCRTFQTGWGCDSTHCTTVSFVPEINLPEIDSVLIVQGDSTQLQGPPGYASYLWEPTDGLSCTDCQSPWASPDSSTTYVVTVSTDAGCTAQAAYRVIAWPPCDPQRLKIPNAITPDGDGVNDVFRVVPFEGFEMVASLTVYDRWGEIVYENYGAVEWDATIDGQPAPSDVYVYIIEILCAGTEDKLIGDVTVIR